MTSKVLALAALAAAGVAASASAQSDERAERALREFTSIWLVQPSEQPLGARTVDDGDYVFRNRLLPLSLIRLTADAVDRESGEVVAGAGTQLFGLMTRGAPIYCIVGRREPSAVMRILWQGGNRQICLVDLDKDGTLDAHFAVGNQVMGVPNFAGRRPRDPDPLTGAAYEELAPDQIAVEYFVGIKYDGVIGLLRRRRTPVFSIVFGTEQSQERLTGEVRPVRRSDPWLVTPMGAEFTVNAVEGDTIAIDVRRNVPAQPFHVVRTVTYSYY